MSLIRCPYCQSFNVRHGESEKSGSNYFEQLHYRISPMQMALLGMRIAKKIGVSPTAGAAVGVVVGGVLIMVSQFYYEKYYSQAQRYKCLDCHQHFAYSKAGQ